MFTQKRKSDTQVPTPDQGYDSFYFDNNGWPRIKDSAGRVRQFATTDDTYDTVAITRTEALALMQAGDLNIKKRYAVSGCVSTLFDDGTASGTTMILSPVSTSKFLARGIGKFYNPKYLRNVPGFGVWDDHIRFDISSVTSTIDISTLDINIRPDTTVRFKFSDGTDTVDVEAQLGCLFAGFIPAGNSDLYTLIKNLEPEAVVSLLGIHDVGGSLLLGVGVPAEMTMYQIGDKRIHGGYVWQNLTGEAGTATSDLELDSTNWVKLPYSEEEYNVAYDEVSYDIDADYLSMRADVAGNNTVMLTRGKGGNFYPHPIQVFQWGNNNSDGNDSGVSNNVIVEGTGNIINFRGIDFRDNTIVKGGAVEANYFGLDSYVHGNDIEGKIRGLVIGYDAGMISNKIDGELSGIFLGYSTSISTSILSGGRIQNVAMASSDFSSNEIVNRGSITNSMMMQSFASENHIDGASIGNIHSFYGSVSNNILGGGAEVGSISINGSDQLRSRVDGNRISRGGAIVSCQLSDWSQIVGNELPGGALSEIEMSGEAAIQNNTIGSTIRNTTMTGGLPTTMTGCIISDCVMYPGGETANNVFGQNQGMAGVVLYHGAVLAVDDPGLRAIIYPKLVDVGTKEIRFVPGGRNLLFSKSTLGVDQIIDIATGVAPA